MAVIILPKLPKHGKTPDHYDQVSLYGLNYPLIFSRKTICKIPP